MEVGPTDRCGFQFDFDGAWANFWFGGVDYLDTGRGMHLRDRFHRRQSVPAGAALLCDFHGPKKPFLPWRLLKRFAKAAWVSDGDPTESDQTLVGLVFGFPNNDLGEPAT